MGASKGRGKESNPEVDLVGETSEENNSQQESEETQSEEKFVYCTRDPRCSRKDGHSGPHNKKRDPDASAQEEDGASSGDEEATEPPSPPCQRSKLCSKHPGHSGNCDKKLRTDVSGSDISDSEDDDEEEDVVVGEQQNHERPAKKQSPVTVKAPGRDGAGGPGSGSRPRQVREQQAAKAVASKQEEKKKKKEHEKNAAEEKDAGKPAAKRSKSGEAGDQHGDPKKVQRAAGADARAGGSSGDGRLKMPQATIKQAMAGFIIKAKVKKALLEIAPYLKDADIDDAFERVYNDPSNASRGTDELGVLVMELLENEGKIQIT